MTVYEALKLCGRVIETLERAGANPADYKYLELYEAFADGVERGEKVDYVAATVAARFGVSVRTVYDIKRRFEATAKPFQ